MSERCFPRRQWLVVGLVLGSAAWSVAWGPAAASPRSATADRAQVGLARVDSLLAAGLTADAVRAAWRLQETLGQDPLYGWQIAGRLGLALLRDGRPGEAIPHLESVMRQDPNDPVAHRNLANALLAAGKKGRALTEFSLAVELAPDDYEARLEYGQVLALFRDLRGAGTQLEVARSLCPDCLEPDLALAGLFLTARQFEAAIPPLQRINDRDPTTWARLSLAQALTGAGQDQEMLNFLDNQSRDELSAEEWNLTVQAEGRLGKAERSLTCLRLLDTPREQAGQVKQELLRDHGFWGRISLNLLNADHYLEGLQAADQAISIDGANVVYRNNRVVLLLKLDRKDEAAREWAEVLRLDPSLETKESP